MKRFPRMKWGDMASLEYPTGEMETLGDEKERSTRAGAVRYWIVWA
nr:hypothetical protein [Aminiphilus circumscriptus]